MCCLAANPLDSLIKDAENQRLEPFPIMIKPIKRADLSDDQLTALVSLLKADPEYSKEIQRFGSEQMPALASEAVRGVANESTTASGAAFNRSSTARRSLWNALNMLLK